MSLTQAATLIRRSEGLRLKPYRDAAGHWTVGYGHKMTNAWAAAPHGLRQWEQKITKVKAEELLAVDMLIAAGHVDRLVKRHLSDGQRCALVSFVFNLGGGAFKRSTLLRRLNERHDGLVPTELLRWVRGGGIVLAGLVTRRLAEAQLFWRGT